MLRELCAAWPLLAMQRYLEFLAVGCQIGSGPTQSRGKATTQRVKGVGKGRDADNAEAMRALEALEQNGARQDHWNARLQKAV